jgi:hypothetical protein
LPKTLPLVKSGYSMKPDMIFGWNPEVKTTHAPEIPLSFDYMECER